MRPSWEGPGSLGSARGDSSTGRADDSWAAVHAFFRCVAVGGPGPGAALPTRLAIPRSVMIAARWRYLTEEEAAALVAAPNPKTYGVGRRDPALLLVAVQTGLRDSEITSFATPRRGTRVQTVHIHCLRKGREMRCTHTLTPDVAKILRESMSTGGQAGRSCLPWSPTADG